MLKTLRIQNVQVVNSSNILVTFTEQLTLAIVPSNVSIVADASNVPDSEVLKVRVIGNQLSILCQPLTELAAYFVVFKSTVQNPFISVHGTAKIVEDGVTNQYLITGPLDPDNPVKNYLNSFLNDNIYDIEDDSTIVSKYIKSLSVILSKVLYDIRQVKNENYLSFTTIDTK